MYYVKKTITVQAAHHLKLDYESPCTNLHGHEWKITVYCKSNFLNQNGMVVDFMDIKRLILDKMDHKVLNDVFDFNPTAENIAKWVHDSITECYSVDVQESENNIATYETYGG